MKLSHLIVSLSHCLIVSSACITPAVASEGPPQTEAAAYISPYSVKFSYPLEELIGDILHGERGSPKDQSKLPYAEWYSDQTRQKYGAWGPPSKIFDPPNGLEDKPAAWKRERVQAIALRYVGYSYQHHHLPDWDPPIDWPWKEVGHGSNAKGVDCSNFTGFVYNLALGVKLSGDIKQQSEQTELTIGERSVKITRLEKPASYTDCAKQLRTGDLLYICDKVGGQVSHVILWVGDIGRSPEGVPLILDSTGSNHKDSKGRKIPDGVHLRPFREKGWYYQSLSHIHRIIPG